MSCIFTMPFPPPTESLQQPAVGKLLSQVLPQLAPPSCPSPLSYLMREVRIGSKVTLL